MALKKASLKHGDKLLGNSYIKSIAYFAGTTIVNNFSSLSRLVFLSPKSTSAKNICSYSFGKPADFVTILVIGIIFTTLAPFSSFNSLRAVFFTTLSTSE